MITRHLMIINKSVMNMLTMENNREEEEDHDDEQPTNIWPQMTAESLQEPLLSDSPSVSSEDDGPSQRGMILYCSLFFFHGISGVTWGRFSIVYYNSILHLSEEQIGVLQGVVPLIALLSQPFWGSISDCFRSKKMVYLVCKFGSALFLLALSFQNLVQTFPQILFCVIGMAIFRSSGVLDSHALDFLGERHRGYYGNIRMWASISWGLGCILMGYITDKYSFEWNFVIFGVMMTCMLLLAAIGLPSKTKAEQAQYEHAVTAANGLQDAGIPRPKLATLYDAVCRLPVIYWLLQGVVLGAGVSLVDSFLFVYLQNDLHASTTLCGWTVGVTVLLELPIFFYSQSLLKNLGHDRLFVLAMAGYLLRVFGYTLLKPRTVHYIFAMEILHGVTVGCMWIASVDFAAAIAPIEWSTTVQTMLSTAIFCVGGGLGPMVGGWVMEQHGAVAMYRGAGVVVGVAMLGHLALWGLYGEGPHGRHLKRVREERHQTRAEMDATRESPEGGSDCGEVE
ncbi:Major facilitator superfamily domain-containing protein 6 [Seminavis robusta]|uniref:Major facilitator superfamily domain-containing protein 6 n=1 Tax=Seminavis robusta TaxID=568900 RepID=A0A9N8H980_9STRA|nr:Major facilitator superfamily domain-containing protein 6 [Seminavis robusta]|eukprot:Sro246_g097640.1 Major facilitator superfamily domain-containing protein 6 (508) ;mRNA; f:25579-27102